MADGIVAETRPDSESKKYIIVAGRRQSSIDAVELTFLFNSGLGVRRLSKHFRMSRGAVDKRLRSLGLGDPTRSPPKKDRGQCKECFGPLTSRDTKLFCSRSCGAKFVNRQRSSAREVPGRYMLKPCKVCSKEHRNAMYCSAKCAGARSPEQRAITAEKHRVKNLAGVRRYQAKLLGQTPNDADHHQIKEIYAHCPDGYEVDHVIPISKGGLHHQQNLQYLPLVDNRRKGSKMPSEFQAISSGVRAAVS